MSKKDPSAALKESIALLEIQLAEEKRLLKEELSYVVEHLKPSNVIKDSVLNIISTLQAERNLFGTIFGTLSGYLASAVFGQKPTMLNKVGAKFLQQIVAIAVSRNSPAVADVALNFVSNLRRKVENRRRSAVISDDIIRNSGEAI